VIVNVEDHYRAEARRRPRAAPIQDGIDGDDVAVRVVLEQPHFDTRPANGGEVKPLPV